MLVNSTTAATTTTTTTSAAAYMQAKVSMQQNHPMVATSKGGVENDAVCMYAAYPDYQTLPDFQGKGNKTYHKGEKTFACIV